jgi:hypothetical protein
MDLANNINAIKNNSKNIEIQYFGDFCYYFNLLKHTHIYFNDALAHQKGLFLNRMRIYGPNKIILLTIPLEGGRSVKGIVKDLKIANREPWQRTHWRSIHDSYRKAPWFDEYAPGLSELYGQSYNFLWDWNLATIQWALDSLKCNQVIMSVSDLETTTLLPSNNTKIQKASSINYPVYNQVFSDRFGFIPNLSIVDLIMNEGPEASKYLLSIEVKD